MATEPTLQEEEHVARAERASALLDESVEANGWAGMQGKGAVRAPTSRIAALLTRVADWSQ